VARGGAALRGQRLVQRGRADHPRGRHGGHPESHLRPLRAAHFSGGLRHHRQRPFRLLVLGRTHRRKSAAQPADTGLRVECKLHFHFSMPSLLNAGKWRTTYKTEKLYLKPTTEA